MSQSDFLFFLLLLCLPFFCVVVVVVVLAVGVVVVGLCCEKLIGTSPYAFEKAPRPPPAVSLARQIVVTSFSLFTVSVLAVCLCCKNGLRSRT